MKLQQSLFCGIFVVCASVMIADAAPMQRGVPIRGGNLRSYFGSSGLAAKSDDAKVPRVSFLDPEDDSFSVDGGSPDSELRSTSFMGIDSALPSSYLDESYMKPVETIKKPVIQDDDQRRQEKLKEILQFWAAKAGAYQQQYGNGYNAPFSAPAMVQRSTPPIDIKRKPVVEEQPADDFKPGSYRDPTWSRRKYDNPYFWV